MKPIPLYDGSLNAFFINHTGKLKIKIIYTLQESYELGTKISLVALTILLILTIFRELRQIMIIKRKLVHGKFR